MITNDICGFKFGHKQLKEALLLYGKDDAEANRKLWDAVYDGSVEASYELAFRYAAGTPQLDLKKAEQCLEKASYSL